MNLLHYSQLPQAKILYSIVLQLVGKLLVQAMHMMTSKLVQHNSIMNNHIGENKGVAIVHLKEQFNWST